MTQDPIDHGSGVIINPAFRVWLRPDGIVQIVFAPRIVTGLAEAVAALEAITQLTGGRRRPLMVDIHDAGPQDRPARAEYARRDDVVSAVAIIVGTPLSRVIGDFYLLVNKPIVMTRLFGDEASAVAWLLEFVELK